MDLLAAAVGSPEVDLVEFVANDLGAPVDRLAAGELLVQLREPPEVGGLGFGSRLELAVGVDRS